MNAMEIVKDFLEKNGYDGLFSAGECACVREDLAPCGNLNGDCEPGYIHRCEACEKKESCPLDGGDEMDFCLSGKKEVPSSESKVQDSK